MSGFIEGENRHQATLFPEKLDDFVSEANPAKPIQRLLRAKARIGLCLNVRLLIRYSTRVEYWEQAVNTLKLSSGFGQEQTLSEAEH